MTMHPPSESGIDILMGDIARLEDVVDREALTQVCRSFFDLFSLSVRVFSSGGGLLADVHEEQAICHYVNSLPGGRAACGRTVGEVKDVAPSDGVALHPCFTGALYRVVPIRYQGRAVGRFVVGPYLPAEMSEVPRSLLAVDPAVKSSDALKNLEGMPRVRKETAERIALHLQGIIDLLLFSSHRAHLTSEMHIASVRESYRELAEKTQNLQNAYERLKELDKLKSNFLATVSHELRTPLTSIIGYSEMLESGIAGDMNEEQIEFVGTIKNKGDHLLELITSLLDLGKLEQGAVRLEIEAVDPAELLGEVASNFVPMGMKKNVNFAVTIEPGVPPVAGEPVKLKQILFNLTDNALKFSPEGGTVHLTARATELEDEGDDGGFGAVLMGGSRAAVEFEIRDEGMGMAEAELPKIFDAFYQVDSSSTREHGGAGLGLSIVKRLVDAHEGLVSVESELGSGTRFLVTIPEHDPDDG